MKKAAKRDQESRPCVTVTSSEGTTTLTWANTGKPVTGGDLDEGEPFEVELTTGKVRR
jgi:hypothetical protein